MRSGKQPFISYESVRSALDSLLYTSNPQPQNPLEALLLIDNLIGNPDLPPVAESREFALRHLLISIITRSYTEHCQQLGFAPALVDASFESAAEDIRRAASLHNPELMGWCLLYYRYVRVDLALSLESMALIAHIESRTLRRYQNHAVGRLRDCLVAEEWDARTKQRKMRLYATLPISQPIPLIGREGMFYKLQSAFFNQPFRHVQVTGPPGIGKSVFVQEFLRRQIDMEQIDHLVWIENPKSIQFVRHYLHEQLLDDLDISLKEYALIYNLAVVLDGFECEDQERAAELQQFLNEISSAMVFVTSRMYIPLLQRMMHLTLKELDEPDALVLIEKVISLFDEQDFDLDRANQIYKAIGGNPYALMITARNLSIYHVAESHVNVLGEMFHHSYAALDDETRLLWLVFAFCPPIEVPINVLSRLWPSLVNGERVMRLLRCYLIYKGYKIGHYMLPLSSRIFIQAQYVSGPVNEIFEELDRHLPDESPFALEIVEHILLSDWRESQADCIQRWARISLPEALRRGHYARWVSIIENLLSRQQGKIDVNLKIWLGMCLRRVSQWSRAYEILDQAMFDAGISGQFYEQGRALFELGILYRQQGYYEKAAIIYEKAEGLLLKYGDSHMLDSLRIERAQAALDGGDAAQALAYLHDLALTGRVLAMRSEISLILGDLANSLALAQQAFTAKLDNQVATGRLYALIGRIYDRLKEPDNALRSFALALTILEREGDLWALARAQSNMGALLICMENRYEAYELLSRAENIQVRLGDRIGLEITRHNFHVLRAVLAVDPRT